MVFTKAAFFGNCHMNHSLSPFCLCLCVCVHMHTHMREWMLPSQLICCSCFTEDVWQFFFLCSIVSLGASNILQHSKHQKQKLVQNSTFLLNIVCCSPETEANISANSGGAQTNGVNVIWDATEPHTRKRQHSALLMIVIWQNT